MKPLSVFVLLSSALAAQTVNGVGSAANIRNTVLARGGAFVVYGSNLGPAAAFRVPPPYTTSLGPYSIVLKSADGVETPVILQSVAASVAFAIVPSNLAEGDYELIYVIAPARSRPFPVKVANRSLSLFSQSGSGTGPALAAAANRIPSFVAPVRPSELVTILATGLGATSGTDNRAEARPIDVEVELLVGRKLIKASSQGRSAVDAGLDEVRFIMPEDAEIGEGCYVPVRARIDGVWSNIVTLPKANTAAVCTHPLGVDESVLRKLLAGQNLVLGNYNVNRRVTDIDIPGRQETVKRLEALGRFWLGDGAALLNANGRFEVAGLAEGECQTDLFSLVSTSKITPEEVILNFANGPSGLPQASALDGGSRSVITLPSGVRLELTVNPADGVLSASPAEADLGALSPGNWELEWAGGSQLAGGKATLKLDDAEPLVWEQPLKLIDANEALALKWTTKSGEPMPAFVFGIFLAQATENTLAVGTLNCSQIGPDFTIPQSVMQRMPQTESGRAMLRLNGYGPRVPFSADYRNQLGKTDYAAFAHEAHVVKVREYKR